MTIKKRERVLLDPGYRKVYVPQDENPPIEKEAAKLSKFKKGEIVKPRLNMRKSPVGMSDAMLLRIMESRGVGRPSTYVDLVSGLIARQYVVRNAESRLTLTGKGQAVLAYVRPTFPLIFNYSFTRQLEQDLEKIELKMLSYERVLQSLWAKVK